MRLHSRFRGPVPTLRRCGLSVPAAELVRGRAAAGCSGRDLRRSSVTSAEKADWSTAKASATRSASSSSPSSRADNSRARTVEIRRHRRAALRCGRTWNRPDTGLRVRTSFSLDIQTNLPLILWSCCSTTTTITTTTTYSSSRYWSYRVLWNSRAACRRWQFQTRVFRRFGYSRYGINSFTRWHQRLWYKRWGVWGNRVGVRGWKLWNRVPRGHFLFTFPDILL